jgi:predicted GNAT family acetyltransferase
MLIQQEEKEHKGVFFVEVEHERLAAMTYSLSPGIMIIEHTEVDDKLKGKNVGYQLVSQGAEWARSKNLKIIPLCPFARSVFKKKKAEFMDVWKQ